MSCGVRARGDAAKWLAPMFNSIRTVSIHIPCLLGLTADAIAPTCLMPIFQGGEELLVLVNAENNQPQVILPSGPFSVKEDEDIAISGVQVADIDMEISANYELAVRLSVTQGVVSLNGTNGLHFSVGDGVEDELVYFHGSADSVSDALSTITYRGHYNW